jgi:hypothetical protein
MKIKIENKNKNITVDEKQKFLNSIETQVRQKELFQERHALDPVEFNTLMETIKKQKEKQRMIALSDCLCSQCEKPGELIICEGGCYRSFHISW